MTSSSASSAPSWRKRHWRMLTLLFVLLVPAAVFAAWTAFTLSYAYSSGFRSGYVQKLSQKGWVCKTWEGELAMANLPGTMPQIFKFSVRDDSVAHVLERDMGKQVSVTYAEHRGIPTTCFGETNYYITNVKMIQP